MTNHRNQENLGIFYLITFSLMAGIIGLFIHALKDFSIFAISSLRGWVCVVCILGILFVRGQLKELKPHTYLATLGLGVFQGLAMLLYFYAIVNSSMANAAFLLYTAPIFSIIFAYFFLKETIEIPTIIAAVLVLIGVLLIMNPSKITFSSKEFLGNLAAIGSGVCYAAMGIVSKPVMKKATGLYSVFWQFLIIAIMFSPSLFFIQPVHIQNNILPIIGIGTICSGFSYYFFMEGAKRVKAQKIFILTSPEPLFATIMGFLFYQEKPGILTLFGAAFIIGGIYYASEKGKSDKIKHEEQQNII